MEKLIILHSVSAITNPTKLLSRNLSYFRIIMDITGKQVSSLHESSKFKSWIKLIPIAEAAEWSSYPQKDQFKLVANVVVDNDKKPNGAKSRQTVIKVEPVIPLPEFKQKDEWLYIFTINDRIVKIGGSRTGLADRFASYLCGHHIPEREKSGDCSKTNGFVYNTFDFYLNVGAKIQMYGMRIPRAEMTVDILGTSQKIVAQTYHAYESCYLDNYRKTYGRIPFLCDNSDPAYRS